MTRVATTSEETVPPFVTGICGECHAVTDNAVSPNPQAPGFADIANSPGLTRDTLVTFLSDAHNYPMQMDVDLVDEDIELIADYMMTLQSDDYVKRPG
jgi:mono/diheme cytochrome c family protein